MKIISQKDISLAAECLRSGGLVAFPTETVYGLGANALDKMAVAKIFEAKERPTFDPLIVHIHDISQIEQLFEHPINPLVYDLAKNFWPGPLTIVHAKTAIVPDLVSSGLDTVGVRMPEHTIALALLKLAGCPVAAPSANKFGQLSPTHHTHVAKQNMPVDFIIETDSELRVGIESTVVSVANNECTILRPGFITAQDIEAKIPGVKVNVLQKNTHINAPGLLDSHYSPTKPLFFVEKNQSFADDCGVILHSKANAYNAKHIIYASETGDMLEIAANLFSVLHKMEDNPEIQTIYIERIEEKGIGIAIMDRLKKATFRYNVSEADVNK